MRVLPIALILLSRTALAQTPAPTVLDTVKVSAMSRSGFDQRRRSSGSGRFLTPTDIARGSPTFASEIFRNVQGVSVANGIKIRGPFGDCTPALYINGHYWPASRTGFMAADLDMWMTPAEIAGVEIYFDAVPPEFQQALSGCGSIVIWKKQSPSP